MCVFTRFHKVHDTHFNSSLPQLYLVAIINSALNKRAEEHSYLVILNSGGDYLTRDGAILNIM